MKIKVAALIDGFNLYGSLNNNVLYKYKWLNFYKIMRHFCGNDASLEIHYFTTVNYEDLHRYKKEKKVLDDKKLRHLILIKAEKLFGVRVHHGSFKNKEIECPKCHNKYTKDVEKQTDVALGAYLVYLAYNEDIDKFLILSADTDLISAIKLVKSEFKSKTIELILPPGNEKSKISNYCHKTHIITEDLLKKCLFPPKIPLKDGKFLECPGEWM